MKIAGTGQIGSADGPGNSSSFFRPSNLVLDQKGNLYISDSGNSLIRKIILK
jgi:hypothetical protein